MNPVGLPRGSFGFALRQREPEPSAGRAGGIPAVAASLTDLKADDVRALNHVREREQADIGLLISLHNPTAKMKADAASAGIYHGGADGKTQYPRLQLLTIAGLLGGGQRAEHPDYIKNVNFKKAKRETKKPTNMELF